MPLVLAHAGKRLAKRNGAAQIGDLLGPGASSEQAVGWMASSAGLIEPGATLTAQELLARFDPTRLHREPAVLETLRVR